MKFTTLYNPDIVRIESNVAFNEMYSAHIRKNNVTLIYAIGFLTLATLSILFSTESSMVSNSILTAFGIHYLLGHVRYRLYVNNFRKENKINVEEMIQFEIKHNKPTTIEFREDEFCYENSACKAVILWEWFDEYKVIENIIFIKRKGHNSYIISKAEYTKKEFEEILKFISKKISRNSNKDIKSNSQSNPELIDDNSL
ncbi:MAG: hypothetical protein ACJA0U_002528 [Salibacteraceae bacterium]|jgi:hypothetical protein